MPHDTDDDRLLLHALADHELDASTALLLERRLAAEPPLAAEYERILAVTSAMKRLERPAISDAFAARITALASVQPVVAMTAERKQWRADWRAIAALLVLTAALASSLTYSLMSTRDSGSTEDAILSGHRRSLLASSAIDVASSDRHTVRPWFDGKLGVSPPTPDLAAKGFPLVGGRVDVIADQPVPTLVYRHKEHMITVVALPVAHGEDKADGPVVNSTEGYNIIRWTGPGFRYWAVSDLDKAELSTFVEAMRAD